MHKKLGLLLFMLVTASVTAVAENAPDRSADESAIKRITQEFMSLRDSGDEAALRALLTAACDQRLTSGSMRSGRDAVVSGSLDSTRSRGGERSITLEAIRFLGDDVALANGRYDSTGRNDGTDLYMRTTMIFWRVDGEWRIDAIRNVRSPDHD